MPGVWSASTKVFRAMASVACRELGGQLCPDIEPDINSGDMGFLEIMALIRNKGLDPDLIPRNR